MGAVKGSRGAVGARPPSQTAYFVALGGVLVLLLLLLCYFFYFCVRRVKELSQQEFPEPVQSVRPPPKPSAYPVQPGVRESATAMAKLCQLPPTHTGTVFPASPASRSSRAASLPPPRVVSAPLSPAGRSPSTTRQPANQTTAVQ